MTCFVTVSLQSRHCANRSRPCAMSVKKPISNPIRVLVADSSQMQLQLLTRALRRRPSLKVDVMRLGAGRGPENSGQFPSRRVAAGLQRQRDHLAGHGGAPPYPYRIPQGGEDSGARVRGPGTGRKRVPFRRTRPVSAFRYLHSARSANAYRSFIAARSGLPRSRSTI